jgi:hypothetical protein
LNEFHPALRGQDVFFAELMVLLNGEFMGEEGHH